MCGYMQTRVVSWKTGRAGLSGLNNVCSKIKEINVKIRGQQIKENRLYKCFKTCAGCRREWSAVKLDKPVWVVWTRWNYGDSKEKKTDWTNAARHVRIYADESGQLENWTSRFASPCQANDSLTEPARPGSYPPTTGRTSRYKTSIRRRPVGQSVLSSVVRQLSTGEVDSCSHLFLFSRNRKVSRKGFFIKRAWDGIGQKTREVAWRIKFDPFHCWIASKPQVTLVMVGIAAVEETDCIWDEDGVTLKLKAGEKSNPDKRWDD